MDEVRAVLNAPDITTRLGIRDRAMLHLCFAAGLRVSELVGLPLTDLSFQGKPSVHLTGKGRRERCLPLFGFGWSQGVPPPASALLRGGDATGYS
jgi:site-specific recombinase XerD